MPTLPVEFFLLRRNGKFQAMDSGSGYPYDVKDIRLATQYATLDRVRSASRVYREGKHEILRVTGFQYEEVNLETENRKQYEAELLALKQRHGIRD